MLLFYFFTDKTGGDYCANSFQRQSEKIARCFPFESLEHSTSLTSAASAFPAASFGGVSE